MDAIIKTALTEKLNDFKKELSDAKGYVKLYRRYSLSYYKDYKRKQLKVAFYEEAIARIEKELKNGK